MFGHSNVGQSSSTRKKKFHEWSKWSSSRPESPATPNSPASCSIPDGPHTGEQSPQEERYRNLLEYPQHSKIQEIKKKKKLIMTSEGEQVELNTSEKPDHTSSVSVENNLMSSPDRQSELPSHYILQPTHLLHNTPTTIKFQNLHMSCINLSTNVMLKIAIYFAIMK